MRADDQLRPILEAFQGPRDDPSGNGFVTQIIDARGPTRRRQYLVRWTLSEEVPRDKSEEWMPINSLVPGAQAMARAYEVAQDEEDDDDDDDENDDAPVVDETQEEIVDRPRATRSAIRWDPSTARPKVSLRAAVRYHITELDADNLQTLREYVLNRRWALQSRTAPTDVTNGELEQVARDLFEVDRIALESTFKRERLQARRERIAAGDDEDEEEDDEDDALATWRAEREAELAIDVQQRWAAMRREYAVDLTTLDAQDVALDAMERTATAGVEPAEVVATARADGTAAATIEILQAWANGDVGEVARLFSRPRLKVAAVRDFLSANRSASTRGYLALLRKIHGEASAEQRRTTVLGSAYSASWPTRESATELPPDHVCATSWMEKGTKLIIECAAPDQLAFQCVISRLSENSSKSNDALGVFSPPSEATAQGLYAPRISVEKKARLAKLTVATFLLLPLLSNRKTSIGMGPYERGVGVEVYARAWRLGPFRELLLRPPTPFERRVALLQLAMPKWGITCAFALGATLTPGMERMLVDRFRGTDGISRLVDAALRSSLEAAP